MPRGDGYDRVDTRGGRGSKPRNLSPLLILASPRFRWAFIIAVLFTCGYLGSLAFSEHKAQLGLEQSQDSDTQSVLQNDAWRQEILKEEGNEVPEVVKEGPLVDNFVEDKEKPAGGEGKEPVVPPAAGKPLRKPVDKVEVKPEAPAEEAGGSKNEGANAEGEEGKGGAAPPAGGADGAEGDAGIGEDTNPTPPAPDYINPAYDHFAVALKTGQDMALTRAPVQLMTYLKAIRNMIVIGEAPGVFIGDIEMIDVYSDLYKDLPQDMKKGLPAPAPPAKGSATRKANPDGYPGEGAEGIMKRDNLGKRSEPEPTFEKPEIFASIPLTPDGRLYRRAVIPAPSPAPATKPKIEDAIVEDKSALGWRSDAHKNLPGLRELWSRFPDAKWYFMVDDDTYVFWENMRLALSTINADEPHYYGAKNVFKGCDGVKKFGDGPHFAHGGSGIVISRGAMKKIMEEKALRECIVRYRTCWAGDIRTALCLRDHGIKLEGLKGFNKEPPNVRYWYPREPCDRPLTFHHLLVKQIQKLYDLERQMLSVWGSSRVTFGDIAADWLDDGVYNVLGGVEGTDRKRGDLTHLRWDGVRSGEKGGAEWCEEKCEGMMRCHSWVWDGRECWLKEGIPPVGERANVTSGFLLDKYRCRPR
ncbi:hypothetical protein HDV00_007056 [Rhizophlyctis rosea]|nr:hypothetical protein HDV00_007056 [Rhizophlyctis rosea]